MSAEDYYNNLIAERLSEFLAKRSITSKELSEKTGINKSKISRVLRKKGIFSVPELHMISKSLHVDINYFISDTQSFVGTAVPILNINKPGRESHIHQIAFPEFDNTTTMLGIYVDENHSTHIIPVSSVLIVNMQLQDQYDASKPLLYLAHNRLHLGILDGHEQLINISDSTKLFIKDLNILGALEKQIVQHNKKFYPEETVLIKCLSLLKKLKLRYDFLYKLLLES